MGRWSRRLARKFLSFAEAPEMRRIIDVGCGTGPLALTAATRHPHVEVLGVDVLPAYLAEALRNAAKNVRFEAGDAMALPMDSDQFDAAFCQLVLNDIPSPETAVREMVRVVRPQGRVAVNVWDRFGGLLYLRLFLDTVASIAPAGDALRSEILDVPIKTVEDLIALFQDCGLENIEETTLTIRMDFLDFQDYWAATLSSHSMVKGFVAALSPSEVAQVHSAVRRAYLHGAADGRRSFTASAWAIKGDRR
jgi:SAM-dependent methyltransferase